MTVLTNINDFNLSNSWVTVGSFDGVHLGHQELIKQLAVQAHLHHSPAVVITFHPHPAVFFGRVPLAYSLTSPEERARRLAELGIDHVITLEFNHQLANLTALNFMQMLKDHLGISHLFIGFNFALGRGRSGNLDSLQQIGKHLDYTVNVVQPIKINGEIVSSSQIRALLQKGNLGLGNQMLGRPYSLEGNVIHGEHRGNRLGFPTANLDLSSDRLLPANGVYASRAVLDNKSYLAVTNIGIRPTFADPLDHPRVEPHILDMQNDLYGDFLKIEFIEYLRPEIAFASPAELIAQVNKDIQITREHFSNDE